MKHLRRFLCYAAAILFVALIFFPFYWQLVTSFKHPADISLIPTELWPHRFSTQFYQNVFFNHHFGTYLGNSLIVGIGAMAVSVALAIPAAYAFTRVRFALKRFWKGLFLLANALPVIAMLTPLFVQFRRLHLLNTYAGVIIPNTFLVLPLAVWTLSAFLEKIPVELEQAALVDGASLPQAFVKILLPLMAPGVFSVAIVSFITTWNDFMISLVMLTKDSMRTVPIGIALFAGQYTVPWGDMAAASIVATVPVILLILIFQKQLVSGLTSGAVKG